MCINTIVLNIYRLAIGIQYMADPTDTFIESPEGNSFVGPAVNFSEKGSQLHKLDSR